MKINDEKICLMDGQYCFQILLTLRYNVKIHFFTILSKLEDYVWSSYRYNKKGKRQ